jgi:hypothetical protein
MTSPERSSLLKLYQRVVCPSGLQYLEADGGRKSKRGIYSAPVVLWLMMLQRLQGRGTLASGVQLLLQGAAKPLLTRCRRVRRRRISCRTGGYCQARQKLPIGWMRQVSQEIIERLREVLQPAGEVPVLVVDGSTVELEHSRSLAQDYPPSKNQHGRGHWPVVRVVVMHEVHTGMAQQPCWGPANGPKAVSEQALAETAIASVPLSSVVVGDRNFGVFSIA